MALSMQGVRTIVRIFRSTRVSTCCRFSTTREKKPKDEAYDAAEDEVLEPKALFRFLQRRKPGIAVDVMLRLQRKLDLSPAAIRDWWKRSKVGVDEEAQIQNLANVKLLGPDIAAAYFVVNGGGKGQFVGHQKWFTKEDKEDSLMPQRYVDHTQLEAVDLSGTSIMYDGLKNLENLKSLKWLRLRNCPNIDDWCLDYMSCIFRDTLEYLDLSSCKGITSRGIPAIHHLKKLKTLVLEDVGQLEHSELLAILLEESLPSCKIQGIGYID